MGGSSTLLPQIRVGVVGAGVAGCSAALALLERHPTLQVTVLYDRPFSETCSFGPAGLFRIDRPEQKDYGRATFERFAALNRQLAGSETGIKLVSGYIQSDSHDLLKQQEEAYADIVYNFRWLTDRECASLFVDPSKFCIFFTAFAAEGRLYVPFLRRRIEQLGGRFEQRRVTTLDELGSSFDVVVNSAGLEAGRLANDDTVYPIRGIGVRVEAPWHKHFLYRDFSTFTIPMNDAVIVGSVKQANRSDREILDEDRRDIWERYNRLHPPMKDARVLDEWCQLRPARRDGPRVETEHRPRPTDKSARFLVIHHYGHGGSGFTLGWGTALHAVRLFDDACASGFFGRPVNAKL